MNQFKKNKKAYMAGKLFSQADRAQRVLEYERLEKVNKDLGINREIFSPIYAPVNDKSKLPSSLDIFNFDESQLMNSDVIFVDLTDADAGTLMELGMVIYSGARVYAYISDVRIPTSGHYDGIYVPYGYNQFVIGGIEKYFEKVYLGFEEAINKYIEDEKGSL